ncbi:XkdF-like putative serine protease domain-containing protein [Flavobacterium sp. MFBS3-15]|uniref:XkdF-like putative serine protease domain-containing protein n=1 Tax=Flavobacterium sp. MFBS3-15 TaxID=2989816 RepID=UPI0022358A9F|nr:XkdF-like putative serine protease domain-containing protein [Flavobacterium sp. MFBS3-15]MCW4470609.1 XkdF-like putative serine protease domain-containing protein [Flavobacterium sp. MFBS3-15]
MKTYEALYDPKTAKGVFGISLVEQPAMEGNFIALSDTEVKLSVANEEERILIGLVLEPNKPIYRSQDGEEFYVNFSERTIKDLAFGFYKGGHQQSSSLEHSGKIEGVTFVESWIIEDSENDKSKALGLSYPKGSWMATMKVDSDEIWNRYVKTGKVKGFSIDALVSLKEVNFKTNIKMSDTKRIAEAIRDVFESALAFVKKGLTITLGSVKTTDDVVIHYDGDTLQPGTNVWTIEKVDTEVPLPPGEYMLEDNRVLIVTKAGKAGELKAAEPTEEKEPAAAVESAIRAAMLKYHAEHKKEIDALKAQIMALSAAPAAKPIRATPEQAKPKTAKQRIFQAIQNQ